MIRSDAANGFARVIVVASQAAPASMAVAFGSRPTVARVPPSARVRTCIANGRVAPALSGPATGGATFSVLL